MHNLGLTLSLLKENEEAREVEEEVVKKMMKVLGEEHPQTHAAMDTLSGVLVSLGQFPQALEECDRVLSLRKQYHGTDSR